MKEKKWKITAEVDENWMDFLGEKTRNEEGFVWIKVKEIKK
jgi:hypothetical protein